MEMLKKICSWLFLFGIVIAIIAGLLIGHGDLDPLYSGEENPAYIAAILGFVGFVSGIITLMGKGTITENEMPKFMMATIIIIALGSISFGNIKWFGDYLDGIVSALAVFIAPIAGIIAIKAIWDVGKD